MTSQTSSVRLEREGPVATIILSRTEARNAVNPETADALSQAFLSFENDGSAHVAVLLGRRRYVLRWR